MLKEFNKWLKKSGYDVYPKSHRDMMYWGWKAALRANKHSDDGVTLDIVVGKRKGFDGPSQNTEKAWEPHWVENPTKTPEDK